jgi:hypothetical protein
MEYKCTKPNQQPYLRLLVKKKIKMVMLYNSREYCWGHLWNNSWIPKWKSYMYPWRVWHIILTFPIICLSYGLIPCISYICCYFQCQNPISQPTLWPSHACWANFDFSTVLSLRFCRLAEPCGKQSACFTNLTYATFTGNTVDTICCHGFLLSLALMSELRECVLFWRLS